MSDTTMPLSESGKMSKTITIPKPVVPYGPEGVTEDIATAAYMLDVVNKISNGGYIAGLGGSNVTATIVALLKSVAEALQNESSMSNDKE